MFSSCRLPLLLPSSLALKVRNAVELALKAPGLSADVAILSNFLRPGETNVDALVQSLPDDFQGWLSDEKAMGEWAGVTTDGANNVIGIDLEVLDPGLEKPRHRFPRLQELRVPKTATATDLRRLAEDYRYHTGLKIHLHKDTNDLALAELAVFPPDNVMSLQKGDKYLEGVVSLHPELTRIDLMNCPFFTEAGLVQLVRGCPKLLPDEILTFFNKGDKFLEAVAALHPELTHIDLEACMEVTDSGLEKLLRGCPKLLPDKILTDKKGDKFLEAVAALHPELTHIDLSLIHI